MTDERIDMTSASDAPKLRALLSHAAGAPTTAIAVGALVHEARRRSQRRRWGYVAGVLAVAAGVGGQATGALQPAGQPGVRVRPGPPDLGDRALTTTTVVGPPDDERRGERTGSPVAGASTSADGRRATTTTAAPGGAVAPTDARADDGGSGGPTAVRSAEEGCTAQGRSDRNVALEGGGAGVDHYPSCTYVATARGGYQGHGSWRVEIERDGVSLTIESKNSPACAADVIRPGDEVTAIVLAGANSPSDWYVKVGNAVLC